GRSCWLGASRCSMLSPLAPLSRRAASGGTAGDRSVNTQHSLGTRRRVRRQGEFYARQTLSIPSEFGLELCSSAGPLVRRHALTTCSCCQALACPCNPRRGPRCTAELATSGPYCHRFRRE